MQLYKDSSLLLKIKLKTKSKKILVIKSPILDSTIVFINMECLWKKGVLWPPVEVIALV